MDPVSLSKFQLDNTKNSTLDVSDCFPDSGVGDVHLSDHQMTLLTRTKAKIRKTKFTFTERSYNNYNQMPFQDTDRTDLNTNTNVSGVYQ